MIAIVELHATTPGHGLRKPQSERREPGLHPWQWPSARDRAQCAGIARALQSRDAHRAQTSRSLNEKRPTQRALSRCAGLPRRQMELSSWILPSSMNVSL